MTIRNLKKISSLKKICISIALGKDIIKKK